MASTQLRRAAWILTVGIIGGLAAPLAAGEGPPTPGADQLAQRCLACHQAGLALSRYGQAELAERIDKKRDHPAHVALLKDADAGLVAALAELLAGE